MLGIPADDELAQRVLAERRRLPRADVALHVGRFATHKNVPRLATALGRTAFAAAAGRLLLVGGGDRPVRPPVSHRAGSGGAAPALPAGGTRARCWRHASSSCSVPGRGLRAAGLGGADLRYACVRDRRRLAARDHAGVCRALPRHLPRGHDRRHRRLRGGGEGARARRRRLPEGVQGPRPRRCASSATASWRRSGTLWAEGLTSGSAALNPGPRCPARPPSCGTPP